MTEKLYILDMASFNGKSLLKDQHKHLNGYTEKNDIKFVILVLLNMNTASWPKLYTE